MGHFPVRYDSRVVIYEHKMFIRLATGHGIYLMPRGKQIHMDPVPCVIKQLWGVS